MSARQEQKRSVRVAERVRAELMELLLRGAIRDPRVRDVLVSNVRVTDDLGYARVYVRTLEASDPRRQAEVVEGLERAAGYIRREVGSRLRIRKTPEFRFFWDDVVDNAVHIERILAEIRDDEQAADGQESQEGQEGTEERS